jgi:hypothetical protein
MFNADVATILFSHLMNAVDVEQMMDSDIHGNDEARDWAKGIFCHALESKHRHRVRCAGKPAKVKEWQIRLIALQDPNRVTDCDEKSEIEALQKQLSETMRNANDDWKNKGLAPWKNDFLHLMTINLGLEDVPVCSAFGAGELIMEITHTDVALVKLKRDKEFVIRTFQSDILTEPMQLQRFVRAGRMRGGTIMLDSPDTGFIKGTLQLSSYTRIHSDDPLEPEQYWIRTTWVYTGPRHFAGSPRWHVWKCYLG